MPPYRRLAALGSGDFFQMWTLSCAGIPPISPQSTMA
jgi:hypothetical protein